VILPFPMAELYTVKHKGCAILCGAAPCLFEDLAEAKKARPSATVLGIKFVASLVPEIEHVWSQHIELVAKIKKAAGRAIKVHTRPRRHQHASAPMWFYPANKESLAAVDYEWPDLHWVAGSSGFAGALWARHGMGFDEVIMAGIPMDQKSRQYVSGYGQKPKFDNNAYANENQVLHWLQIVKDFKESGKANGIYSMSGKTQKLLGAPPTKEN
jgi:hypothetical protein